MFHCTGLKHGRKFWVFIHIYLALVRESSASSDERPTQLNADAVASMPQPYSPRSWVSVSKIGTALRDAHTLGYRVGDNNHQLRTQIKVPRSACRRIAYLRAKGMSTARQMRSTGSSDGAIPHPSGPSPEARTAQSRFLHRRQACVPRRGNDDHLACGERLHPVAMHVKRPLEHEKELVLIVAAAPHELALDFGDFDVLAVEATMWGCQWSVTKSNLVWRSSKHAPRSPASHKLLPPPCKGAMNLRPYRRKSGPRSGELGKEVVIALQRLGQHVIAVDAYAARQPCRWRTNLK